MSLGGAELVASTVVSESQNLWPFLVYGLTVLALLLLMLGAGYLWGTRTPSTDSTDLPFESGIIPVGSADQTKFSIEFYLMAIFFVIFDLETIFLIGWAVAFYELGWEGYAAASVFIVILLAALVYEYRTGALEWGTFKRQARRAYAMARSQREGVSDRIGGET